MQVGGRVHIIIINDKLEFLKHVGWTSTIDYFIFEILRSSISYEKNAISL